jgi:hypothetical protein
LAGDGLEEVGQFFSGDAGLAEYLVEGPLGQDALVEWYNRTSFCFRVQVDSVVAL